MKFLGGENWTLGGISQGTPPLYETLHTLFPSMLKGQCITVVMQLVAKALNIIFASLLTKACEKSVRIQVVFDWLITQQVYITAKAAFICVAMSMH